MKILEVLAEDLHPNPWNANVMDADMMEKELQSIREFGFVDPLTVRPHPWETGKFQIIDGEHRWICGRQLGMTHFPVVLLDVDEATAQQLSIVLNETRGRLDPSKLQALVKSLAEKRDAAELERVLPFTQERFYEMIGQRGAIDFSKLQEERQALQQESKGSYDWVERVFRMPRDAAAVVDEAIEKVRANEEIPEWRALELIAADFLA